MAKTVDQIFDEYIDEYVDLDPDVVEAARKSRDNLLDNISDFDEKDDFFSLHKDFNLHFGSFARRTKCRKLDDIDLMIGIKACGATYDYLESWNDMSINANMNISAQRECSNKDGTLNSTKVLNKFKTQLSKVRDFSRSDIHRSGEAVSLNLKSKEWSFDIVPCFQTEVESNGRNYYLIPNAAGKWKKTDPRMDREHVTESNKKRNGKVLRLIRLVKKWKEIRCEKYFPSYLLETMVIDYADNCWQEMEISSHFVAVLDYLRRKIDYKVYDMKDIQGNINTLDFENRQILKSVIQQDFDISNEAKYWEYRGKNDTSIAKWSDIFGPDFGN